MLNNQSGTNIFVTGGDLIMGDKRKAGNIDIKGNISGNIAYQSDYVTQTNINNNNEVKKALEEIIRHAKQIEDDSERSQAELNTEILREAVERNDVDKIKTVLGLLRNSIGTISALTTIAKFFGLAP